MRPIDALKLPDIDRAEIEGDAPKLRVVSPADLLVDEGYQRGLSDRSVRLIRKIVAEWNWRAFKPPVCVEVEGKLHIVDGQHTAIAALTHGGIETLPVMVVVADDIGDRADAFVRHNRDRVAVTPTQLHRALVAAGDEMALTINQVCERAGLRLLHNPPPMSRFRPCDTIAVSTIRALINRRYAQGARRVLQVCAQSGAAPVTAAQIRAVECLMFAEEYRGDIDDDKIAVIFKALGSTLADEAKRFAAERKIPLWRATASVVYLNRRRRNAA